ncbi:MAG: hypothetical protein A3G70_01475 [Planctomycetes bacterium RIFCSPLOWO2_12_FULL_39_13]|nr:MAG: hypothetical protein A3G70_01475 [Planctomycetes bacterium RIFCSPLOWO2_12_FULL_39_13]
MVRYKDFIILLLLCFVGIHLAKELSAAEEKYPDMVLVPAGEFTIGDNTRYNWTFMLAYNIFDGPEHNVYLDAFYIDKYEVTNEQYKKFVDKTGCQIPRCWNDARFNRPNQPVVGVTWEDAVAYAKWAGKRLPTEAEWEKAARGTDRRLWPWGNKFDKTKCTVWESQDAGLRETTPVGKYDNGKSPYGCYDMAGNVWEWCADYYDQNYYYMSPAKNPTGPESGQQRVIRGGGFLYFGHYARCAARYRVPWYTQSPQIGFRCAKTPEK